ncbi:MAG: MATE family efflux transporter [Lachnospiraceae bacterium]|nr:MATE family efflux transporter [Lachnospiraceae bacterium]
MKIITIIREFGSGEIQLSDHFTYKRLLQFTFPSMIMMVFTSLYSVVDGFFVSNFVGKTPFAAVNFIMPVLMILGSIGFMFGSGGSALVSKTMGEGDMDRARRLFSLFVYSTVVCGVVISVISFIFIRPLAALMGAEGDMLNNCVTYARILLPSLPFFMLQFEFQSFFITAEKPQLGLVVTVVCGLANMVLDALFMAVFSWGLVGAAAATAISQMLGGAIPILYFSKSSSGVLRLTKTGLDGKALIKACTNGSSELMSNISMSIVSILYNFQLMKYAGENGIAAYGVLMYINLFFLAIFIGYSTGVAPIVSYHYGAENHSELKGLLKKSYMIIGVFAVAMFGLAELLAKPLAGIFVGYDKELMEMTTRAFMIYSFSFLFSGIAIYGSSFFTALNDGLTSALISFLRSLLFQVAAVMILPMIFGIDGIWFSVVAAELVAAVMTVLFIAAKKGKYHY